MRRRNFLPLLVSPAVAWPLVLRAQQQTSPVIGYLSGLSASQAMLQLAAFRSGLKEGGFAEDRNIAIVFRWADGQYDRLPAMAAELLRHPVTLILAQTPPAALAAKAATTTIPIVFVVGFDPVGGGLIANLARPAGNVTGLSLGTTDLAAKRLELLRELAPKSAAVAVLVNPISPNAAPEMKEVHAAAQAIGLNLKLFSASTPPELDAAFVAIAAQRPDALLVAADPFFVTRRDELVRQAARLGIPVMYPQQEYVAAGGLISFGTNVAKAYHLAGTYAARIIKGAKPADLPAMQPSTFELVINLKTAKTQGIDIPPSIFARADEVIE
jgi:putative tryptophan/tyrosine transport system substrate-binding protein